MNPGIRGMPAQLVLMVLAASIIPFISWREALWLEGTFAGVVFLLLLLEIQDRKKAASFSFPAANPWAALVLLTLFSLFHLLRSPVPNASLLFLTHLLLAMAWYYLILGAGDDLDDVPILLVWTLVLVPWMVVQRIWGGDPTPSGPFFNPNYLATVLLSSLGYAVGSFLNRQGKRGRVPVFLLIGGMSMGGLVLTGSRSAMLGMLILLGTIAFFGRKWVRRGAVLLILVSLLIPTTVRYRVLEGYRSDPHAFSRTKIWEAGLQMGLDHPLVGVGPGLFSYFSPRYAFPVDDLPVKYGRIARKPHNEYIRSWAEGGTIGVLIAVLFLCLTFHLMKNAWKENRAGQALALGMVLFQAVFHDITEDFSILILGAFWLARLTPGGGKTVLVSERKGQMIWTAAALLVFSVTVWINLNGISRTLLQKGQKSMETNVASALRNLKVASVLNPAHPEVAVRIAGIKLDRFLESPTAGNREMAEESLVRARKLNSQDTVPVRMEADLFREIAKAGKGDPAEFYGKALENLDHARFMEPYNALILLQIAGVYEEQGQMTKALHSVEQALDLEPNFFEAHRVRIRYLERLDPSLVPEAVLQREKAVEEISGYKPMSRYEEIILQ